MVNPKRQWNRSENLNKLLSLLAKNGEMRNMDLKKKMEVSDPTLAGYLKELESKLKIQAFFKKPGDRRERWYRIKPEYRERVEAEIGKYQALKIIDGLQEPIYAHKLSKDGNIAIDAFAVLPSKKRRVAEMLLGAMVEAQTRIYQMTKLHSQLSADEKISVVVMITNKGKKA